MFGGGVGVYLDGDYGLLLPAVLFLVPDLSLLGFGAGPRVGAAVYNSAHTYAFPLALGAAGALAASALAVQLAVVWLAHSGADRARGYGLKYPTGYGDTHLQRA